MMHTNMMVDGYSRGGMWHGFGGGYDGFGPMSFLALGVFSIFAVLALIWTIGIKGYSLWVAARRGEKWWFIALLVINTLGLLELVYLIFFAKVFTKDKISKAMSAATGAASSSTAANHDHAAHAHDYSAHSHDHSHSHEVKAEEKKEQGSN